MLATKASTATVLESFSSLTASSWMFNGIQLCTIVTLAGAAGNHWGITQIAAPING
jgi:hypothetical protein